MAAFLWFSAKQWIFQGCALSGRLRSPGGGPGCDLHGSAVHLCGTYRSPGLYYWGIQYWYLVSTISTYIYIYSSNISWWKPPNMNRKRMVWCVFWSPLSSTCPACLKSRGPWWCGKAANVKHQRPGGWGHGHPRDGSDQLRQWKECGSPKRKDDNIWEKIWENYGKKTWKIKSVKEDKESAFKVSVQERIQRIQEFMTHS